MNLCDAPHPEIEGLLCSRSPRTVSMWNGDAGHVHSGYTREDGYQTWADECGVVHRGETEVCKRLKGHKDRERGQVRAEKVRATYGDLMKALAHKHKDRQKWVYLVELRVGTGYAKYGQAEDNAGQSIDAWAMNTWPSSRYERIAYEVKVDKQDFKREIENPAKRAAALDFSNRYYFVVPETMLDRAKTLTGDQVVDPPTILGIPIPDECGLLVLRGKRLITLVPAPRHDGAPPTWGFLASIMRRAQHATR